MIKKMTSEEYKRTSSKGFQGQTIVFTNARARCHTIADALGAGGRIPRGAHLRERRDVETKFLNGKLMAVVTTAALGAGVDFPASQVIFDALAMGRDWLSVQEFNQMGGRAGRPDFHDLGRVVILAEPGGSYSRENPGPRRRSLSSSSKERWKRSRRCTRLRRVGGVRGKCDRLPRRRGGPQPDQQHDGGELEPSSGTLTHKLVRRTGRGS